MYTLSLPTMFLTLNPAKTGLRGLGLPHTCVPVFQALFAVNVTM